ncbi:RelA/SpoT domain-containing protein [Aliarcobacter butzleri]|uniref:RelA/SpoT domain-containing protein n=1 Tax=Aliarcobacter butzleri TaxID=28197 RepID=UPI003B227A8E
MYSKNNVKKAGKKLIVEPTNEEALEILSHWRSTHEKPLNYAVNHIEKLTKKYLGHGNYILAHRPKRTSSIINKLRRFNENGMQLTTMQDIAGCRLILNNMDDLNKTLRILMNTDKVFSLRNDYIREPKSDGYRSIHLVGSFTANEIERPVELQIRTKVQHAWATAVEIVDLFTKQFLKHDQGEENWKDFFIHSSKILGYFETCFRDNINILTHTDYIIDKKTKKIMIKNYNKDIKDSFDKVYYYAKTYNIHAQFKAFTDSLVRTTDIINAQKCKNEYLLLHIFEIFDNKFQIEHIIFSKDKYNEAEDAYIKKEKAALNSNHETVALISTSSIENIKEAYPNYFADSTSFSNFIYLIVNLSDEFNKNINISVKNVLNENFNILTNL